MLSVDEAPDILCQTICMVQYYPLYEKQNLTDCAACINQQPEVGYEQYDNVHAMLEVSVNRSSLLPEVMRLRWFPTTSDPIFSESGIQVQNQPCPANVKLAAPTVVHCIQYMLSAPILSQPQVTNTALFWTDHSIVI